MCAALAHITTLTNWTHRILTWFSCQNSFMQHLQPNFLCAHMGILLWGDFFYTIFNLETDDVDTWSFTGPLTVLREVPCPGRSNGLPCKHQHDSSHVSQSLQDVTTTPTTSPQLRLLPNSPLISATISRPTLTMTTPRAPYPLLSVAPYYDYM